MAGTKALNVRMNFQVDTTQAKQQLQGLAAQLNQITSASGMSRNSQLGITQEIMQATKAAAQLKTALVDAVNPLTGNLNLSKFNDQLIASKMTLSDYRQQLSALGIQGNQAFNGLARSIMTAETPLLRTGKAAQQLWTVLGNTVRWQATSMAIHGIVNTASQAMSYVKALDKSLNSIQIVTGQSANQMSRFAEQANKAAKELSTTTNEYAKASLIYYQQGLSNKQVEERTKTTIKLANVAGQSAKTVSDQMTAVWNNFYDGSKSLEYYADVITALGASTASSSEEIAKGLQKFSSIAKTTGLSYEYATSALSTVVAATRQSADSVGTSFKTLFSRLQGLSLGETLDDGTTLNKYSKALMTVGVNIKQANGDLKNMDNILSELGNKWKLLAQDEKVALAQTIGGARNYSGLMALMDNWDDFQTNLKTAQTAQGTLQEQADIYAQSWEAASKHVRSASETIYKNLLDDKFFKGLTNGFGYVLDVVGEMTNSLGGFRGSMLSIASIATQFFKPQITQGLANLGASIYGMTPKGRNQILDLRTQAMNAVTQDIRFSQYTSVNALTHQYNRAFNERQVQYEQAVKEGRISQYQQPAYQMLLNNLATQEQAAIQQAERMAEVNRATEDISLQQRAQAASDYRKINQTALFRQPGTEEYDYAQYVKAKNTGIFIPDYVKTKYESYEKNANFMDRYYAFSEGQKEFDTELTKAMTGYGNARVVEKTLSDIGASISGEGITTGNVKSVVGNIQIFAKASKDLGIDLSRTIPQLGLLNQQIEKLGPNASDADYLKLFEEGNGKAFEALLQQYKSNALPAEISSQVYKDKIETLLSDNLGIQDTELRARVAEIVTSQDKNAEEKFQAIKTSGLTAAQQAGFLKLLGMEQTPQTVTMSGAITTVAGTMASLANTVTSSINAVKTFGDANATATQKIGAMGSVAMSIGMLTPRIRDFSQHLGDTVTMFGKTTSMTVGKMGLWGILAAAGIMAGTAAYSDLHKTSLSGAIENYNTALATSTQLASDAKSAYENLVTNATRHNNLLTNLSNLTQGTEEFTLALLQANDAATNIIENHDLIYGKDYIYDKTGAITFLPGVIKNTLETAREEMVSTSIGKQQISYAKQILDTSTEASDRNKKVGYLDTYIDKNLITNLSQVNQEKISIEDLINDITGGLSALYGGESIFETNNEGQTVLRENAKDWISTYLNQGYMGSGNQLFAGAQFNAAQLFAPLGVNSQDDLANKIAEIIIAESSGGTTAVEAVNSLFAENYISQRQAQNEAAIRGLVGVTATGIGNISNKSLITSLVSNQLLTSGNASALMKLVNRESIDSFFNQGIMSPEDWYKKLYGEEPENLSDDEITTKVMEGLLNEIVLNGVSSSKLIRAESLLEGLNFTSIKEWQEQLQGINLPNIENLTKAQAESAIKTLTIDDSIKAQITKAQQDSWQYLENQIGEAIFRAYSDEDTNAENDAANISTQVHELTRNLRYSDAQQIYNSLISAGNVSKGMQNYVEDLIMQDRESTSFSSTLSADLVQVLKDFNFGTDLDSLYQNSQYIRFKATDARANKAKELFAKQIEEIGKEEGFFNLLYKSSGFQDVLDKLSEQFSQTGEITTNAILQMSTKSEELAKWLQVADDAGKDLNVNAAGLATVLTGIMSGQITQGEVSSTLLSSLSTAKSGETVYGEASQIIKDLDLGTMGSDFTAYYQELGKAAYQINKAGWGFNSEAMQNIVKLIGGKDVKEAYAKANLEGKTFKDMWSALPTYFTGFLSDMVTRKGKGAGGPEDIFGYYYDLINTNIKGGMDLKKWKDLGFEMDAKGNFQLLADLTSDQLLANFTQVFQDSGLNEEDAKNQAQLAVAQIMSSGGTSGNINKANANMALHQAFGYEFVDYSTDEKGFKHLAGFNEDETGHWQRTKNGTMLSEHELELLYKENQPYLESLGFGPNISLDDFKAQYAARGNQIAFYDQEFWKNTGNLTPEAIVKRQNDVGGAQYGVGPNGFQGLAEARGAFKNGAYDFEGLTDMFIAMGGSLESLINFIDQNPKLFEGKLFGRDKNGRQISFTGDISAQDYADRIANGTYTEKYIYGGLSIGAQDYVAATRAMGFTDPVTGEWVWDYDGSKRDQRAREWSGTQSQIKEAKTTGIAQFKQNNPELKGMTSLEYAATQYTGEQFGQQFDNVYAQLAAKQQKGEALTNAQKQWMELYEDRGTAKDAQTLAKTNAILADILYNTDTVVDQTGEIVDASTGADQGNNPNKKGAHYDNGQLVDEEGNEIEMPDVPNPNGGGGSTGGGNGWGAAGSGTKQSSLKNTSGSLNGLPSGVKKAFADSGGKPSDFFGTSDGKYYSWNEDTKSYDQTDANGTVIVDVPQKASGQNNNLLTFASGKQGQISITGELGPELRVKSDGSMDLLGQHGREYTWVNPDDKIYTAAQTTSILGNKTLEELQNYASGINNFIPGFLEGIGIGADWNASSSGGSSGGGPSGRGAVATDDDHRYDPNWLKYRDVIERYYTILQQIENITNAVTRFSEIADRAWGKERQKALSETIKLQEQQIEAQKKYVSEIQTYFKGDRNALTTMITEFVDEFNEANPNNHLTFEGAEFDENGVLTNYRAFAETLVDQFNEKGSFKDQKAQYKFQEQLKDIQQYTETLNLLEEQETQLAKLEEALFDTRLNEVQVVLEYKMSLDQNQQTLIDYALKQVKDDAYAAAEAVALIGEKQQVLVDQLDDYEQAVRNILAINQGGGRGANGVGLQLVDSNVGLALQSEFDDLKKWRDTFYNEETGEYKETAKIKDEISGKEVEHKWKEYSELLEKYYREYWNMYSDVLPDPDEFLNWTDTDDADKKIIENYEAVYARLEQLQNQLNKSKIEYTYDKFTGVLENSDAVTEQVQKHYEELLETYPQLTDAIKEMDAALIDENTGRLNTITQYANLVNIIDKINEVTKGQLSDEQYQLFLNNPQEFANWLMNPFDNPDATPLTNAEVEQMQGYISSMLSNLTSIQENLYDVIDKMGDSAKAYFKDINAYLDKFDHYKDLYKNWANIIDLSGRAATQVDHELMSGLYMKVTDNYINKLKGAKKAFGEAQDELKAAQDLYNERLNTLNAYVGDDESIKQQYQNLFNQAEENLNNMYKIYTDAENNYYSSWEDALQGLADSFKEVVQNAAKNFEASFSPLFTTLELLQNAYNRQKELKDLYVDSYQQAHDLSKLNRDLANSIIDTDNLQGKQKLRDMQKEINKLQESGVKLSQYDLDVLQKKYDLELARQELEDAKNAKSLVRLARDNNGNWSYVYTASEDDVAAAEQKYEDAVLAMEQANEEYINNLQDQLFQVLQNAEAQIQALDPSQFQTEEDFNRAVQAIRDATVEKVNFINQQMGNALGNNNYLLENVTGRARDLLDGLTSDYGDTILAMTSGMGDLTAFTTLTIDNVDELASRTVVAFSDFWDRVSEVWQEAGHDILEAPTELSSAIEEIGDASATAMEDMSAAVNKASDAFDRLTESITTFFDSLDLDHLTEMISYYENWSQSLTDFIEYMGDWEQETGILKFNGDITQWGQMNQIYKILQDYGTAMLQYIDENGNTVQKELIAGSEETQAWLQQQREKIVTELANYKDLTTLTFDTQKKLDKAIDAINDKLNNQGLMNIDIKGDVFTKLKDEGVLDDFANMVIARDNDKKTATIQLDKVQNLDQVNAFLEKLEEVMKVKPPSSGGGGYFGDPFAYLQMAVAWMRDNQPSSLPSEHGIYHTIFGSIGYNTGGYTGRWQSADTGMYTGEWPNGSVRANGRLAWLHQKELVLNAHDTENFLDAMKIVRQLDNLTNWMANGLGMLAPTTVTTEPEELEQNVHIEASFPNVTNHSEIEQAFDNLVNLASQYANRK